MKNIFQWLVFGFAFFVAFSSFLGCTSLQTTDSEKRVPVNVNDARAPSVELVESTPNNSKKVDSELEKNKRLWLKKNIADYDLTASLYKGGSSVWAHPVLIKVRNRQPISIDMLDEKFKVLPLEQAIGGYRELDTVEKMFDYIQKGLDGQATVAVKYDKEFGYPRDLRVHYQRKGSDVKQTMIISKFEVIRKE